MKSKQMVRKKEVPEVREITYFSFSSGALHPCILRRNTVVRGTQMRRDVQQKYGKEGGGVRDKATNLLLPKL